MSTKEHWLEHRGSLTALASDGQHLYFVTRHPEGQETGFYRLDPLTGALAHQPMPGGVALVADGERWLVAGTDGRLWAGAFGSLAPLGPELDPMPTHIAPLSGGRIALITGAELLILSREGTELSRAGLSAVGTALASDPSGHWIVVGARDGHVTVLSDTESDGGAFQIIGDARLHQGAVFALRFEADELRFRSAAADNRFLITHVRGLSEPLDRGGRHGHSQPMRAMVGDGEIVYTVGEDREIKAWRRGNKRQPATQKKGVGAAIDMAEVTFDGTRHLAVASDGDKIKLFPLDEAGKVLDRSQVFHGAIATVEHELGQSDPERRKVALDTLARYADAESIELLAAAAVGDADHQLQIHAIKVLGTIDNPRAVPALEELLRAGTEAARWEALRGLRGHVGADDLRPLSLALSSGHADIGVEAVRALEAPAGSDEQAHVMLVGALSHSKRTVREQALEVLERLHPDDPEASLLGLRSSVSELRWLALLRLLQRDLLEPADRALRAATDDDDAEVRQIAYHLRLLAHPRLAQHLRSVDPDLNRNLHSLETHGQTDQVAPSEVDPPAEPPETLTPLVQAASSRRRDTCLRGAGHLAALGDKRAFGVLLQLSREGEPDIQVRACRALQQLNDARALGRMQAMLRTPEEQVRDAAFTVIERILEAEPLQAAEIGLSAPQTDVRRRGLRVLTQILGAGAPATLDAPACVLLRRALDDSEAKLRGDAFKVVLRLGIGGAGEGALRFALGSLHEDVRREALTEIMSEIRSDWAWSLLLERFDDPAKRLRDESFAFARKQGRGRDPNAVVAALRSEYADLRLQAVDVLADRVDDRARPLLIEALNDDEEPVRKKAFDALQRAGQTEAMIQALSSRHADVRIGAAASLAEAGRLEALSPLIDQIRAERPEVSDLAALWKSYVLHALQGLAWLQAAEAVEPTAALLSSEDAEIRGAAARTLAWVASDPEALKARIQHSDQKVRYTLALGLAWRGDPAGAALLFGGKAGGADRASAALGLGDDEQLLSLLDASDAKVRARALRIVLLIEWVTTTFPHRLLAALTVEDPRVRLAVAEVLEAWNDPEALGRAVAEQVNGSHPEIPVEIPLLRRIAIALAHGQGTQKASAVQILKLWERNVRSSNDAQEVADLIVHRWGLMETRSRGALQGLTDPGPPPAADVTELVFGTYVGLGGQVAGRRGEGVRASALGRLGRLDGVSTEAVVDALIPALADGRGSVRLAAFQALQAAGLSTEQLVVEALATGQQDLGGYALTLLADVGGVDALWEVLAGRDDGLELVAFDLLRERAGEEPTVKAALEARSIRVRSRGLSILSARYDQDEDARQTLRGALESRFPDVRRTAAINLASRRDVAAFDVLVALLNDDDWQHSVINSLVELGDPRVADALLDRVDNDPRGTAMVDLLLRSVGAIRSTTTVDRLLKLLRRQEAHAESILAALTMISGYDQRLTFDPEEPDADESWLEHQHPRDDAVFAKVLQLRADRGHTRSLVSLFPGATWARGGEVDQPLSRMLHHADDTIRRSAVTALGWRVRFRGAEPAPLRSILTHKDPETAFLAAEGLARAGHADGMTVLLAAVDTLEDIRLQRRAVLALGHLADVRALDKLLDIVNNDEHALIEPAVEAIGHLRDTQQRDQILERLLQLSKGANVNLACRALVGLRWFGSPDAWARIRAAAGSADARLRAAAADLLRHDTSSTHVESREVLEGLIMRDSHWSVVRAAAVSLRRLAGAESLEPDYIFLRARFRNPESDTVSRLRERGDPERILDALADPACDQRFIEPLILALASREPVPVEAAIAKIDDVRPRAGALAARLLGRAPVLTDPQRAALQSSAVAALDHWEQQRERNQPLDASAERIRWMLWAAARHGVAGALALRALKAEGPGSEALRQAGSEALALMSRDPELLEQVARTGDSRARTLAAGTLVRLDRARAELLAGDVLDDRAAAEPLLAAGIRPAALQTAASSIHIQGIALPHLILSHDVGALSAALSSDLEDVRLGVLEALGVMGDEAGEELLRSFAVDESHDEEERKVAWRALRRSKRQRARQEAAG